MVRFAMINLKMRSALIEENVKQLETIRILEYNKDNMHSKIVFGGQTWNI